MGKWKEKRLQDICERITDGTHQTPTYFEKGYIFLSSKNVTSQKIDWQNVRYVDEKQYIEFQKRIAPKIGDILLAKNGTTGVAAMVDRDVPFNIYVSLAWLRTKGEVIPEYLLYFINSPNAKKQFNNRLKGVGVPNLHLKEIREVKMSFPTNHLEQQRIVAKLDGLFTNIDKAIALLQENIQHTQALMGSVLDEIYSKGDKTLKEVCFIGPKKSEVRNLEDTIDVSFLPMKDLNEHNINFVPNELKKINEVYKGYTYFADGDIILAKVTPCFENGKAGLAKDLMNGIGFGSSEYHVLRPKETVLPEWIYFAVLTEQFRITGKENMTGAGGLKRVPRSFLEEWLIPVPDLSVQKRQIKRIVKIQEKTKELEASIQRKLTHLKSLKSSLLDQAFKGDL
ncbi:restriction endonuclease subunit S [Wenyingzhuangia aestuarii]|uniref:restriction endonuclease subunit S n=1 Tax=Wenyingzhuangia aestuarii TaxID=1647582 RepID=UPI00143A23B0|nr:restriction endonuclease subunit S [Wenyingzhuangia aestuarii]NJB83582.1 type I restriction enzyme S subunit [Wenyingzhuangia aestuarii]